MGDPTKQLEVARQALEAMKPVRVLAQLRQLAPLIEARLAEGVTLTAVQETLATAGLKASISSLRKVLQEYRAGRPQLPAPQPQAGATSGVSAKGPAPAADQAAATTSLVRPAAAPAATAGGKRPKTFEWPPKVDRANRWDPVDAPAAPSGEEKK